MKVNFLGDLHGEVCGFFDKNTIQLGDLSLVDYNHIGPLSEGKRFFIDGNHEAFHLINPNSLKPYELKDGLVYIPRGYCSGNVLFVGGAGSVDYNFRALREIKRYQKKNGTNSVGKKVLKAINDLTTKKYIGVPILWETKLDASIKNFYNNMVYPDRKEWFPEEDITEEQVDRILSITKKIEVVVAHDCPISFMKKIVPSVIEPFDKTNRMLQLIFDKFKPNTWIFGHHHRHIDAVFNGCRFLCLDIAQKMEIEVPIADDFFEINY